MNSRIKELKALLKMAAAEIRTLKTEMKTLSRQGDAVEASGKQCKVWRASRDYRIRHVAYCLLRGTPYDAIEKPREGNEIRMDLVEAIKKEYTYVSEDVRVSA